MAVLLGSADTTIKLWNGANCMRTFLGHEQSVRAISLLGSEYLSVGDFVSVGNDGNIKIWKLDGRCVLTVKAHDSFIYSVICAGSLIVTAGELGILKFWKMMNNCLNCIQTIGLPVSSIWSLAETVDTHDILCATSDGRIYVFSNSPNASDQTKSYLYPFEKRLVDCNQSYLKTLDRVESARLNSPGTLKYVIVLILGNYLGQLVAVRSDSDIEIYSVYLLLRFLYHSGTWSVGRRSEN